MHGNERIFNGKKYLTSTYPLYRTMSQICTARRLNLSPDSTVPRKTERLKLALQGTERFFNRSKSSMLRRSVYM